MLRLLQVAPIIASLFLLVTSSYAAAQTPATSFADLRLTSGTRVTVLERTGREITGRVTALSSDTLSLVVDNKPQQMKEADVQRISRQRDSVTNGALWGLGVGGALAAAALTTCDPNCNGGAGRGGAVAFFVAGGVGFGILVDWLIPGRTTVYEAPGGRTSSTAIAPMLTRRGGGLMIGVSF